MSADSDLVQKFERRGVSDPKGWARSERHEGISQLARATLLHGVWDDMDHWSDGEWVEQWASDPNFALRPEDEKLQGIVRSMLEAGISPADIATLASAIAHEAAFGVLFRIDEGWDVELGSTYPGWRLVEVDGQTEQPTGRDVGGLHESLLSR